VYAYRPVLLPGCGGKGDACVDLGTGELLQLPGFGVELALKNMEYSALDDSNVSHHCCLFWL
jgi:UDP-glucose:glycoprotein glucosyltransferase